MYYIITKSLTETIASKNSIAPEQLKEMTGADVVKSPRLGWVVKSNGRIIGRAFETLLEAMDYNGDLEAA